MICQIGMKSAKKMADKLVRMAMSRGTTDNVSVMAIRLRDD
jgi:serine/threonine protein phosphatase PrpC